MAISFFSKLPSSEKQLIADIYNKCSTCECVNKCNISNDVRMYIENRIGVKLKDNEDEFEALYKHINNS